MLSQHIVIKPVLDALFPNYPFTERNVIACSMTRMLDQLDQDGLNRANDELHYFYDSVQFRMRNVESVSDRQKVIMVANGRPLYTNRSSFCSLVYQIF